MDISIYRSYKKFDDGRGFPGIPHPMFRAEGFVMMILVEIISGGLCLMTLNKDKLKIIYVVGCSYLIAWQ
jgi:hypothetical protein